MKKPAAKLLLIFAIFFWFAGAAIGFGILLGYEIEAGPRPAAVPDWPMASEILLNADKPTLIMFVHPKCPCTRASIHELARLVAQCQGGMSTRVMIYSPESMDAEWSASESRRSAAAIPGVRVQRDEEGRESRLFDARTSGYCVLYTPAGELLFSGGITRARGHEGDNSSRAALTRLIRGESRAPVSTPAFGCSMFNSELGASQ